MKNHKTPGIPKFLVVSLTVDSKKISAEDKNTFWSGVGMLLYLLKRSRPDIANATREVSKVNDGANPSEFHQLLHVIRYLHNTKNLGLKLEQSVDASKP